ncbi:MAG: phytanoyl-CoA dioxygenase family protein [Actinobacteria bacterium]|nr:phytanoyl-CoA dioxygenase family protein [Actinomycetota bacterium]
MDGSGELAAAAAAWRRDGFVVLPGYLDGPELAAAQRDLAAVYPSAADYHAAPGDRAHQPFSGDEFGGIIAFPFPTVALSRLVVHDRLIALAAAVFGTDDLRVYASELWAKYSGAARYEQEHHRDYLNHTPLVPSRDRRWRGLELFIWLSDVPEDHGPTHVVPLPVTAGVAALPHGYLRTERPDFYQHERSAAGPAGTVVAYSTDTFHRGTEITAPRSARFSAHVSYRHADNSWTGRQAWGDRSFHPDWAPFVTQASVRQLLLFGFPPPGHPYWTRQTVADLAVRYPGLDTSGWPPAG